MTSADIANCGSIRSNEWVGCVVRICQADMTDECFNTMTSSPDYISSFHPLLFRTCRYDNVNGLSVALSENCRRVCRADPIACRALRQQYCSTGADPSDPRTRDLCACYLPYRIYTQLTTTAIADLALASAEQLASIRDILSNNLLTPSCWYQECAKSTYGIDTELTVPCQSVGLCIQDIDVTHRTIEGRITLTNECTIKSNSANTV